MHMDIMMQNVEKMRIEDPVRFNRLVQEGMAIELGIIQPAGKLQKTKEKFIAEFFPNDNQASPQFIIRDNHGIETAICMTFDVKQLNMILYYIKDIHDKLFQIICFDWQKDYLRRIMPSNVVYRTFPMSIIQ